MSTTITANDLKTKGVSAISGASNKGEHEVLVTVRGKTEFVIIPIAQYNHLRECELEAALAQSRADMKKGRYRIEPAARHMKRIRRA
ncbi:MAG: type II toxin-antitoxin system prevent-host-death family antitoxin [Spirochaetota bacterium]